jgi:hypothetical protein
MRDLALCLEVGPKILFAGVPASASHENRNLQKDEIPSVKDQLRHQAWFHERAGRAAREIASGWRQASTPAGQSGALFYCWEEVFEEG